MQNERLGFKNSISLRLATLDTDVPALLARLLAPGVVYPLDKESSNLNNITVISTYDLKMLTISSLRLQCCHWF